MHARDLVELAATMAVEARLIIRSSEAVSERSLRNYWRASRNRQAKWARELMPCGIPLEPFSLGDSPEIWLRRRAVLEEVLLSEVLTRVVTAVLAQRDREPRGSGRMAPVCRPVVNAIFLGHLEARRQALHLMVHTRGVTQDEGVRVNWVRRRCEHWTDLLLAAIASQCDVAEYAIDVTRVTQLANSLNFPGRDHSMSASRSWIVTSLRAESAFDTRVLSPHSDLNRQVGTSVLEWVRPRPCDAWGIPRNPWMSRLVDSTRETQRLIDELLCDEDNRRTWP